MTLKAKVKALLDYEPTDKELADIAGSKEANIRTMRSNGNSKALLGYIARVRENKLKELIK